MELIYFFIFAVLLSTAFRKNISKKSFVYIIFFPIFIYLIKELSGNDRVVMIALVCLIQMTILSFTREKA
ncbi:MAG: hypothetical protein CME70_07325 [Halobacteriovorax sp.]|nr:hypothetical protein [Halobacteriovorax sp.]|tara:strand:+ start:378109 stop:378318 length:210 start_codon:yes stop_codon:yes gene_type:complete